MVKAAFIFPGQGAQKAGMGKEFYDASPEARAVFDEADKLAGNGLKDVIFNGPSEKLTETAFCQPGILTFSIAALKAFQAHPKFKNIQPVFAAGLSLGEYSALAASGALSFEETVRLVQIRGRLMDEACKLTPGKMAAVIGFSALGGSLAVRQAGAPGGDKDKLVAICHETGAEVANFNSPQQIVITGHASKVEAACEKIKAAGAKSVIPLEVAGAFHSSLMQPAAEKFKSEISKVKIAVPQFGVVSNVDGRPSTDPEEIRAKLSAQITSPVQWVESIQFMASHGAEYFIEIGPGKVLTGLIRRIDPNLKFANIETPADIEKLAV